MGTLCASSIPGTGDFFLNLNDYSGVSRSGVSRSDVNEHKAQGVKPEGAKRPSRRIGISAANVGASFL